MAAISWPRFYAPFSWNTAAVEENDTGQASPLMLPRACAEPEFLRPRYTPDQGSPAIHDEQMSRNSYHGRSEFSVKCHAWARCTRNSACVVVGLLSLRLAKKPPCRPVRTTSRHVPEHPA